CHSKFILRTSTMRSVRMTRGAVMATVVFAALGTRAQSVAPGSAVNAERAAYYGDLHLLTTYSFSAYLEGVRVSPEEAYRFARGESVSYQGRHVRRTTPPLDFLAVTDQVENLGLFNTLDDPKSPFSQTEIGKRIHAHDPQV